MKFMIAVDCEGASCVVGTPGKALSSSRDYAFACEQVTRETNAAASALFDGGAREVLVWDSHSQGINLCIEELDPRCGLLLGKGFKHRFPGLDSSFSGVLMIGYHAMEGTRDAVLAHTYSSDTYESIRVNGTAVGEIALDASAAGEFSVPLIFLSSDNQGCQEARQIMPWVRTVITKEGMGHNCALSKHPKVVQEEIYAAVRQSLEAIDASKPLVFPPPIRLEIRFKAVHQTLKSLLHRRRDWRISGPRTIVKELQTMLDWNC